MGSMLFLRVPGYFILPGNGMSETNGMAARASVSQRAWRQISLNRTLLPQSPTNCTSHGFGFGFLGGGTAEGGVGVAGAGASGSAGAGIFYSGQSGASAGGFIEGGAFANAGPHSVGAPTQTDGSLALGAFAGVGGGLFVTNAGSPQQLSGPFLTFSADIGTPFTGAISFQLSISSNNTFMLSAAYGPGAGIGGSVMTTTTGTTGGSCP